MTITLIKSRSMVASTLSAALEGRSSAALDRSRV
jgi:hypothetical protein